MQINHILLIDDDDAVGLIITAVLSKTNIVKKIKFSSSGPDALEFLKQSEEQNDFPEAVFVDLNMPEMDGYEFIPIYESLYFEKYPLTKVIVVTSSSRVKDQEMALNFKSVKKFINKPLNAEKILSVMQ